MAFIQNNLINYSVLQLCNALKFPRSTYYKALACVPLNRCQEYEKFGQKVEQVYGDSKNRYGAAKICHIPNGSVPDDKANILKRDFGTETINPINLHVKNGCIYGLLERSGAGKTMIMKMVLGLASITSGEVQLGFWSRTGQIAAVDRLSYYGFTTIGDVNIKGAENDIFLEK